MFGGLGGHYEAKKRGEYFRKVRQQQQYLIPRRQHLKDCAYMDQVRPPLAGSEMEKLMDSVTLGEEKIPKRLLRMNSTGK